jgi:MFS family permease
MVMLFAARILDGITGGNITIAQAYVSDITRDEDRAQGLGLLQAAFGAGFIFGPAFGGVLGNFGPLMPFIGATIVTTATLLLTVFTLEESLSPEERTASLEKGGRPRLPLAVALRERTLLLMLTIGFLASLAFSSLPSIFSLFADNVVFAEAANQERISLYIGLMLAFLGVAQVFTQLRLVRPLVEKLGERRLMILGQVVLLLSFGLLAAFSNAVVVTLLLGTFAFGTGVSEPTMQALVTRFGGRNMRGHLLGLYQSARSLALIGGPIMAGAIYENIFPQAAFWAGTAVMGLALVGAVMLLNREIKPIEAQI